MRFLVTISIVYILLLITGCDIFSTRPPDPPTEQRSNFIQPTTPEIVITNFKNSIEDFNIDNYIKCFVDTSFSDKHFEFGASFGAGVDQSRFIGWNLESERQYMINLGKPSFGSAGLVLSEKHPVAISADSVVYNFDYTLYYPQSNPNVPTSFYGNLQFYIAVDQNKNWGIYKWLDFKTNSPYTWSYLKTVFIGG
jgi:hypothetical protein